MIVEISLRRARVREARWCRNFTAKGSRCSPCLRGEMVFGTFSTRRQENTENALNTISN